MIAFVYKIASPCGKQCYVGSTTSPLNKRLSEHKSAYKRWVREKGGSYTLFGLFQKYGVLECQIELIKEYVVIDKRHLAVYETLWIKKLHAINKNAPAGGLLKVQQRKQYEIDNKEKMREYHRQYYIKKKHNKSEKVMYYQEYYQNNKDIIKERSKEHYEKNKKGRDEMYVCECGSNMRVPAIRNHNRSMKHLSYLKAI